MKTISARDLQVFVAGALAFLGFQAFMELPHYFSLPHNEGKLYLIIAALIGGLALPIAIGLLLKKALAPLLASLYLWLSVAFEAASN